MMRLGMGLCSMVAGVQGWSKPSHVSVALESAQKLSPVAVQFVAAHLHEFLPPGGKDDTLRDRVGQAMAEVSAWADGIRESSDYHYSNTRYQNCGPFELERDCEGGRCLVTGIERYIAEASDTKRESKDRVEAIMFLIHLVADATQPLHTGFRDDVGATRIQVVSPTVTSLHVFWDFDLPAEYRKQEPVPDVIEDLPMEGIAAAIVSQTTSLTCEKGYTDETGNYMSMDHEVDLSRLYIKDRARVAGLQLKRAAHYLAQILNFVANQWKTEMASQRTSLRSITTPPPATLESANRFVSLKADLLPAADDEEDPGSACLNPIKVEKTKVEIIGVDLETVAIKPSKESIFVTSKELACRGKYMPRKVQEFDVAFGPVAKRVLVDSPIFRHPITSADLERIFEYLKKPPVVAASAGSKVDVMFRRAQEAGIRTGERAPLDAEFAGDSPGDALVFKLGRSLVILDEADLLKDRLVFVASQKVEEISGNMESYLLMVSSNLGSKNPLLLAAREFGEFVNSADHLERIGRAENQNRRLFLMLYRLDSFVTGLPLPAFLELIPGLIRELRRIRPSHIPGAEAFEVVYSTEKSTIYDDSEDDLVFFSLSPEKLVITAKHLLTWNQNMVFSVHYDGLGNVTHLDTRLVMTDSLKELMSRFNKNDYDSETSLDSIPQTRQVRALKEVRAELSNGFRIRHALSKFYHKKDKDGETRLFVDLKGNNGK